MNFFFLLSCIVTICFIIAVTIASYTPDTDAAGNRQGYISATAIFALVGIVSSAVLTFYLYPKSNQLLDKLKKK